jgi:hypothetical protein
MSVNGSRPAARRSIPGPSDDPESRELPFDASKNEVFDIDRERQIATVNLAVAKSTVQSGV